jgi:hypothetical protein
MISPIEIQERTNHVPLYLRFPKTGSRCPLTGLSRPFLYQLAHDRKIRTVKLGGIPGARQGVSVIETESLLAFIRSQAVNTPQEAA